MAKPKKTVVTRKIVKVEANNNRLRLALPVAVSQQYYGISQKRISLGLPDTPDNRKIAEAKAAMIQSAIAMERFDPTLAAYNLGKPEQSDRPKETSIPKLWQSYQKYKSSTSVKPKTIEEYNYIKKVLTKLDCSDPLLLREQLISEFTHRTAKRTLMQLSAAHKWGIKHELVKSNPFDGMASELGKCDWELNPNPNPFSSEEKQAILASFEVSQYYAHYYSFVNFLFLTGCRPSEAVGIQWKNFDSQRKVLTFEGSITEVNSVPTRVKLSKNNQRRTFPVNTELWNLLVTQCDRTGSNPENLIFPSPTDKKPIRYSNFSRRAWHTIVDPIKPETTPYCCRDTFISEQIAKGIPPAVVAKWVDNSVQIIEKHYLGDKAFEKLEPL